MSFINEFIAQRAVNRRVALLAAVTAAVILALNLYAPADPSALQRLMASLLLGLCALPTLLWASDRDWGHSLMPFAGVTYGLYFGSPIFLRRDFYGTWFGSPRLDDSLVSLTLLLALAGWALLLAGHFGPHRRWLADKLPRVEIIPAETRRYAAALAVVIGIAAAPFFYIHIDSHMVAFYTGRESLPSALAFPVELAGQFVVLSVLILFYLQLRGQLGLAGKAFMWLLVAYYTLLGLSSGLIMEGLDAIFALFVAWAATTSALSWKGAAYGVLTAAILLFVLIPIRSEYRSLIWTHGVDADAGRLLRESTHVFTPPGDTGAETSELVAEAPDYVISYGGGVLTYYYKEAGACDAESADAGRRYFFLHIFPSDPASLPSDRAAPGFENLDFPLDQGGVAADGQCVHQVSLPAYAIDHIRTGPYRKVAPVAKYLSENHQRESKGRWQNKTLTTFVAGSYHNISSDEQWLLNTVDATSWKIDTEMESNAKRRIHIYETDEGELAALAAVRPGDLIRVEADADNWAEYVVKQTLVHHDSRVIYRLLALTDYAGDRSALREGGAPAAFFYPFRGDGVALPVTAATETRDSPGRNPYAPSAGESQVRKVATYLQSLWNYNVRRVSPGLFHHSLNIASTRLDFLLPVAWVIHQTPENVPYLKGETYYRLLFTFVPRLLWEDKPRNVRDFGQRYGFIPEGNEINGFKLHHLGEFYINFGALGILLGMLLLGLLYRVAYQLFFHAGASVVTMAAGAHILTVLVVNMESTVAVALAPILWYVVLLALLGIAVRAGLWAWRRAR